MSRAEAQEIEQIAPTRRGCARECYGVIRSANCIIPPKVIPLDISVRVRNEERKNYTDISRQALRPDLLLRSGREMQELTRNVSG